MGRNKIYKTEAEALAAKKIKDKERYQNKKEEIKLKAKANGNNEKSLMYYHKNKEELTKKKKIYYQNNKSLYKEYGKKYREANKEIIKIKKNSRQFNRRKEDCLYKLKGNISALIRISFIKQNYKKKNKTVDILGCSMIEFKKYLEAKFENWMTWDNKGNPKDGVFEINKTWDIDHIIPISSATTEDDVIRLNHYTNLQPLCSYINRFVKINKK